MPIKLLETRSKATVSPSKSTALSISKAVGVSITTSQKPTLAQRVHEERRRAGARDERPALFHQDRDDDDQHGRDDRSRRPLGCWTSVSWWPGWRTASVVSGIQ